MHLRIFKIFLIFFPLSILPQQFGWYVVSQPPGGGIVSIDFVDSLYGWLGSTSGIRRTIDGGVNWSALAIGYRVVPRSISFIDREKGWMVGTNDVPRAAIYKTNDSGKTWQEVYFAEDQSTPNGKGLSLQRVIAVGQDKYPPLTDTAIIVKTTNGGNNFKIDHYAEPSKLSFKKIIFTDELNGWIYGEYVFNFETKGIFFRTNDGGESWIIQEFIAPPRFTTFTFIDTLNGWAFAGPTNYKTNDGGITWELTFTVPEPIGLISLDINFTDSMNGWVFGTGFYHGGLKGVIYRTYDGGINWELESVGLSYDAYDGNMLSPFLGYAAGGDAVLKYGLISNIEKLPEIPRKFFLRNNYPNPFNPTTTIEYEIPEMSDVELKVFDVLGNEIQTLVNQEQKAGVYRVNFNGSSLSSGTYFFSLKTSNYEETKQMILLK